MFKSYDLSKASRGGLSSKFLIASFTHNTEATPSLRQAQQLLYIFQRSMQPTLADLPQIPEVSSRDPDPGDIDTTVNATPTVADRSSDIFLEDLETLLKDLFEGTTGSRLQDHRQASREVNGQAFFETYLQQGLISLHNDDFCICIQDFEFKTKAVAFAAARVRSTATADADSLECLVAQCLAQSVETVSNPPRATSHGRTASDPPKRTRAVDLARKRRSTVDECFERVLGEQAPGYIPRTMPSVALSITPRTVN